MKQTCASYGWSLKCRKNNPLSEDYHTAEWFGHLKQLKIIGITYHKSDCKVGEISKSIFCDDMYV